MRPVTGFLAALDTSNIESKMKTLTRAIRIAVLLILFPHFSIEIS
jgi:hypothetical protein